MEIPALLADVTPEWLTAALGTEVIGVEMNRIGEGEGFTGQVGHVSIAYGGESD